MMYQSKINSSKLHKVDPERIPLNQQSICNLDCSIINWDLCFKNDYDGITRFIIKDYRIEDDEIDICTVHNIWIQAESLREAYIEESKRYLPVIYGDKLYKLDNKRFLHECDISEQHYKFSDWQPVKEINSDLLFVIEKYFLQSVNRRDQSISVQWTDHGFSREFVAGQVGKNICWEEIRGGQVVKYSRYIESVDERGWLINDSFPISEIDCPWFEEAKGGEEFVFEYKKKVKLSNKASSVDRTLIRLMENYDSNIPNPKEYNSHYDYVKTFRQCDITDRGCIDMAIWELINSGESLFWEVFDEYKNENTES